MRDYFTKHYADTWYKPWTWNPVSRPFGYAAIFLVVLLVIAAVGHP
jgi:hypothetical protein